MFRPSMSESFYRQFSALQSTRFIIIKKLKKKSVSAFFKCDEKKFIWSKTVRIRLLASLIFEKKQQHQSHLQTVFSILTDEALTTESGRERMPMHKPVWSLKDSGRITRLLMCRIIRCHEGFACYFYVWKKKAGRDLGCLGDVTQ